MPHRGHVYLEAVFSQTWHMVDVDVEGVLEVLAVLASAAEFIMAISWG